MPRLDPFFRRRPILTAAVVSALSLLLVQCDQNTVEPVEAVPTEAPEPALTPTAPLTPRPETALSRGELVNAAGQAASTYARGQTPTTTDPLVGRSFAVRMPFGCGGPSTAVDGAASNGLARWTWGPDRKTIQISMTPGDWTASALTVPVGSEPVWEAVDGFWIPRPWLAAEACPQVPGDPLQTAGASASPQTVGIAAVFEAGSSRIGRRSGRAYAFTVRAQGDEPVLAPDGGYRLLLEGRVVGFPGGRAIRCLAPGPDQRPVCVAAVQLDKVAFEDAAGATLSEWRPG
jgi:hypothetical protein